MGQPRRVSFPLVPAILILIVLIIIGGFTINYFRNREKTKNTGVEDIQSQCSKIQDGLINDLKNRDIRTFSSMVSQSELKIINCGDQKVYALVDSSKYYPNSTIGKGTLKDEITKIDELNDVILVDRKFNLSYVSQNRNIGDIQYFSKNDDVTQEIDMFEFDSETGSITGLKENLGFYFVNDLGYYLNSSTLTIPTEINGVQVKNVSLSRKIDGNGNVITDDNFLGYQNLEKVVMNDGIETISEDAFFNCKALYSVQLPNTLTTIKSNAFNACKGLMDITIPNSVIIVEEGSFDNTGIYINSNSSDIYIGNVYYKYKPVGGTTQINIKEGTRLIAVKAIKEMLNLDTITLPEGLEVIDDQAFSGCSNLKNLNIPASLKIIYATAINGCSGLENVMVGANTQIR